MTQHILSFATGFAISAGLIMAIGAQNLFVLRQGLKRQHVGAVVLFCGTADALLTAAGVGGVGSFLVAFPQLSSVLALGGAAFLSWNGLVSLRRALRPQATEISTSSGATLSQTLAVSAGFTLLNPHVYLDTVLLMGAAGSTQPEAARPIFVAGAAMASFVWFAALGYGARLLRPILMRPAAWQALDMTIGIIMLLIGVSLMARVF